MLSNNYNKTLLATKVSQRLNFLINEFFRLNCVLREKLLSVFIQTFHINAPLNCCSLCNGGYTSCLRVCSLKSLTSLTSNFQIFNETISFGHKLLEYNFELWKLFSGLWESSAFFLEWIMNCYLLLWFCYHPIVW